MTRGVLYLAAGDQFVDEAKRSARSVKRHMPDVNLAIATVLRDHDLGIFDRVIEVEAARQETIDGRTWLIDSTIGPNLSPFEKTLYLDSDTYLCDDVSEVFGLLDQYELAVARTPHQTRISDLPPPWHLYNCGVIAYRDSPGTRSLLIDWKKRYRARLEDQERPVDQPAFAKALYHSDIRWFTLPREYNVRIPNRGSLAAEAKIVHGRHRVPLDQIAAELNRSDGLRTFRERSYLSDPAFVVKDRGTVRYRLEETLVEEGIVETLRRGTARVLNKTFGTDL